MSRILVIDDDDAVRHTIQVVLERAGYEVVCVADGEQGVRAFERSAPLQLVITDIIMPNKEGLETIIEIRSHDATTPIIAVSGGSRTGNADFLKMALKFGANALLPKPFGHEDLVAAVHRLLPVSAAAACADHHAIP